MFICLIVAKKIEKTIEKIPGLGPLIEKITDNLAIFIFTTLGLYLAADNTLSSY